MDLDWWWVEIPKSSHGAGPYHAPESDNHNDNAYHICNVVMSHILFNMILNMNIEYNIHIVRNCNDISRKGVRVRGHMLHILWNSL